MKYIKWVTICVFLGEKSKFPLKGDRRKDKAQKTDVQCVSNVYYTTLGKMRQDVLEAGNLTECQTPSVLRKINSEARRAEDLHREGHIDIMVTQQVLADVDIEGQSQNSY